MSVPAARKGIWASAAVRCATSSADAWDQRSTVPIAMSRSCSQNSTCPSAAWRNFWAHPKSHDPKSAQTAKAVSIPSPTTTCQVKRM